MKPSIHAAVSSAGGLLVWVLTGSWTMALWSLLSGVLIDLDHLYEYFKAPRPTFSLKDFFNFFYYYPEPKLYIWLHAWEWVGVLGFMAWVGWAPKLTAGLAIGFFLHLLTDQLGNSIRPGAYFLSYRKKVGFQSKRIFYSRPEKEAL